MKKLLEADQLRKLHNAYSATDYKSMADELNRLITRHTKEPDVKKSKIADEIKSKLLLHFTNPKDKNYGVWLSDEEATSIIGALESIQPSPTAEELQKAFVLACKEQPDIPYYNYKSIIFEAMACSLKEE